MPVEVLMKYMIQNASADNADRYDEEYPSDNWRNVATGDTYDELLADFMTALNDEVVNIENGWVRLIINPGLTTYGYEVQTA